jgi:hypothetical protein
MNPSRCLVVVILLGMTSAAVWGEANVSSHTRLVGIFRQATLNDGETVLAADKELRLPGTTKTRALLPAGTRLGKPTELPLLSQNKAYQLLLWEGERPESSDDGGMGAAVAVLAVFAEGKTAAVDVAEVKTDRETWLIKVDLKVGEDETFSIVNSHLNAGEEFITTDLFFLRDGRLRRIASESTDSTTGDGCRYAVRKRLRWRAEPATATALPAIVADIETVYAPKDLTEGCEAGRRPRERRTIERHVYGWDASKDRYVMQANKPPAK